MNTDKVMKFLKSVLFSLVLVVCTTSAFAQDTHFSQYYAMPVQLNPALTGFTPGKYRVAGIYRSQWATFAPYVTQGISFDISPKFEFLSKTDFPGVGILLTNDVTGLDKKGLQHTKAYGSLAMNKGFGRWYLGMGFQFGYSQRSFRGDPDFGDEWVNDGANSDFTGSTEETINISQSYADLNFGGIATYRFGLKEVNSAFAGVSAFHINRPTEEFSELDTIPLRMVYHAGSRLSIPNSPYTAVPNFIYMRTQGAQELVFGFSMEYDFTKVPGGSFDGFVSLGGYYRNKDAAILALAIGVDDFVVGFSYDLTRSDLSQVTSQSMTGAFELSIRFTPIPNTLVRRLSSSPCPRI